nr:iron chelate uptake ABC transporter family permease subunit [Angustibacter aerolatus]
MFQSVTRNVLASPDVIGVTSGASASAAVGILLLGLGGPALAPLAIGGALVAAVLMYALAWRGGVSGYRFVLVGVAVAAVCEAATSYVLTLRPAVETQRAFFWLTGSLNSVGWADVRLAAVGLVLAAVLLPPAARRLRALEPGRRLRGRARRAGRAGAAGGARPGRRAGRRGGRGRRTGAVRGAGRGAGRPSAHPVDRRGAAARGAGRRPGHRRRGRRGRALPRTAAGAGGRAHRGRRRAVPAVAAGPQQHRRAGRLVDQAALAGDGGRLGAARRLRLARMFDTCTLAVLVLMNRCRPISPLLRPCATRASTSCSRAVRASDAGSLRRAVRAVAPVRCRLGQQRRRTQPLGGGERAVEARRPPRPVARPPAARRPAAPASARSRRRGRSARTGSTVARHSSTTSSSTGSSTPASQRSRACSAPARASQARPSTPGG